MKNATGSTYEVYLLRVCYMHTFTKFTFYSCAYVQYTHLILLLLFVNTKMRIYKEHKLIHCVMVFKQHP